MKEVKIKNNQLVSNIGLFYICYELSKRRWNCLPTTRNAKGADLIIYSQDGKKIYTIQVKALTDKVAVPFGNKPNLSMADFVIITNNVFDNPEVFLLNPNTLKNKLVKNEKSGRISHWFSKKDYEPYKDNWGIIGNG